MIVQLHGPEQWNLLSGEDPIEDISVEVLLVIELFGNKLEALLRDQGVIWVTVSYEVEDASLFVGVAQEEPRDRLVCQQRLLFEIEIFKLST